MAEFIYEHIAFKAETISGLTSLLDKFTNKGWSIVTVIEAMDRGMYTVVLQRVRVDNGSS